MTIDPRRIVETSRGVGRPLLATPLPKIPSYELAQGTKSTRF
jgi:hypothetical protein